MTYEIDRGFEHSGDGNIGEAQYFIDDLYREWTEEGGSIIPRGAESGFYPDVVLPILQAYGMAASFKHITWENIHLDFSPDEGIVTVALNVPLEGQDPVTLRKEFKASPALINSYLTIFKPVNEKQTLRDAADQAQRTVAIRNLAEFAKHHMDEVQEPEKWAEIGAAKAYWPTAYKWDISHGDSPNELHVTFYGEENGQLRVVDVIPVEIPE